MYTISRQRGPWQTAAHSRESGRIRELVILIEPDCIGVKPKKTRRWFRLPWGVLYQQAVRAEVLAAKSAKQQQRSVRRGRLA